MWCLKYPIRVRYHAFWDGCSKHCGFWIFWRYLKSHGMHRFPSLAALGPTCSQGLIFERIPIWLIEDYRFFQIGHISENRSGGFGSILLQPIAQFPIQSELLKKAFVMCILLICWTYETNQAGRKQRTEPYGISQTESNNSNWKVDDLTLAPHTIHFFLQEIYWVEFFAGLGNLTTMMRASQYRSFRFDIEDHQQKPHRSSNFMDLTHASGFGFLGFPVLLFFCNPTFDRTHHFCQPRLAILALLRCIEQDFACHFGIKCSSFSKVNIGTSQRSACDAIGFTGYASVINGNILLERTDSNQKSFFLKFPNCSIWTNLEE